VISIAVQESVSLKYIPGEFVTFLDRYCQVYGGIWIDIAYSRYKIKLYIIGKVCPDLESGGLVARENN